MPSAGRFSFLSDTQPEALRSRENAATPSAAPSKRPRQASTPPSAASLPSGWRINVAAETACPESMRIAVRCEASYPTVHPDAVFRLYRRRRRLLQRGRSGSSQRKSEIEVPAPDLEPRHDRARPPASLAASSVLWDETAASPSSLRQSTTEPATRRAGPSHVDPCPYRYHPADLRRGCPKTLTSSRLPSLAPSINSVRMDFKWL
jgi:hypothetical protein